MTPVLVWEKANGQDQVLSAERFQGSSYVGVL
jgi:hypothetical protein